MSYSKSQPSHLEAIQSARAAYRPDVVDYLIIAEAPPCAEDRYFYFENVRTHDSLFLNIMEVLFPDVKKAYLRKGRPPALKIELLERFREHGFFLLDVTDVPEAAREYKTLAQQVPAFIEKVKLLAHGHTKIIIIKTTVYDLVFRPLVEAGVPGVIEVRIPFPGSGQQTRFKLAFRAALEAAGYALL